ncbi:IS605 OrfB family transposase [Desulfofundulus luciae]|uniref:IS605 OrfB family transposase n=1 Tax=Desulfofundulus luciae TaxID=74702 RepID=A0ABU0B5U7_9FIRM|nr:transposase [Desulfofundulus luciae]MDQ0287883.1 IS605 OrfB family transposase [Desulfofundulus luciae]
MEQVVTLKLKLYEPTQAKREMYQLMADRCTDFANRYLSLDKKERPRTSGEAKKYSEPLPSAVLNQAIRDIKAKPKAKRFKHLWPAFSNQNFRVEREVTRDGGAVWKASFPTLEKRVGVPIVVQPYQEKYLEMLLSGRAKQGSARLVRRGKDWYVHLSLTVPVEEKRGGKVMGVDLGMIDLLVASVSGQTLFFSGDELVYVRRHYAQLRKKLQKAGAYRALKRLGDKEHRWVTDVNHKVSRMLVDFAIIHGVTKIRLEDLTGARWAHPQRREQRKDHGRSLQYWPYYQLRQFIEYKAVLAGIRVELVNPDLTTLTCSRCGEVIRTRPKGRWFRCPRCRRVKHVDVNAADNIAQAVSGLAA